MTTDRTTEWTHIDKGLPPTDGEKVFVGVNSIGYCGCFNNLGVGNISMYCFYETAEECLEIMSKLTYWKLLEMPEELNHDR